MTLTQITDTFSVSADIDPSMARSIADARVGLVIGTAPNRECVQDADSDLMQAALAGFDIDFAHVPVVIGLITEEQINAFRTVLDAADGPVLAYCHSGLRAALMWALAMQDRLGTQTVLDLTQAAGFDVGPYLEDQGEALIAA